MNTQQFGRFISELRKEKTMTQMQLAERLNVTDKAVSRWETGKNFPDIEIFEDLSKVLDVSVSELLEGKRIEKEELFITSEKQVVKQIKKNKKSKKAYMVIISVILIFTAFLGCLTLQNQGVFDGVIYHRFPCYSNDLVTAINTLEGYIDSRPESEGNFKIDNANFFFNNDKTFAHHFYLSGTCENGRYFYMQAYYDEAQAKDNHFFVGEFRENQNPRIGVNFDTLKDIVTQLNFSALPEFEEYHLDIEAIETLDNHDLELNEYQKSITKLVYSDGILKPCSEKTISGTYAVISIIGYGANKGEALTTGELSCLIYCEM